MNDSPLSPKPSRRAWLKATAVLATASALPGRAEPPAKPKGPRGEIIVARADKKWSSQQLQEACVLPNPKVPGRLVMFYSGVPVADRVVCAVGKAWAKADEPFKWHQDAANPVFRPTGKGWDAASIRLDCVLYVAEEDNYYIYYSATDGRGAHNRIGLAVCPAGDDGYSAITEKNIVRFGVKPVLAPEAKAPFHEELVSQSAVLREWDAGRKRWDWFMYYSYRGKDGVLPGIRLATSPDGKTWTRQFNADDPRKMGQIFASTPESYYEWHQVFKVGDTYVLSMEVGVKHGQRWRAGFAVSKSPDKGWKQLDLDTALQTKWGGLYDDKTMYHLATPAFYKLGDKWYLFAQACGRPKDDNYINGEWELWCVECDRAIPTLPGFAELMIPGAAGK